MKSKNIGYLILLLTLVWTNGMQTLAAQAGTRTNSTNNINFSLNTGWSNDSIYAFDNPKNKKLPWRAALETVGLNLTVWGFNKAMGKSHAQVTFNSIKRNFKTGFLWDNDRFPTNMFSHPYHGNLYYNTARSSGLNFWQSAPYTLAGSLLWEMAGECEPPSINDLMATTFGGIALGEMTFRLSSLVLDDSQRGFKRFGRELLGLAIAPIRGFNRLITGDMWKVKHSYYKHHDYNRIPVYFSLGTGVRYLENNQREHKGDYSGFIDLHLKYGDIYNTEENKPYDFFATRLSFSFSKTQPLINEVNLLAKLWSTRINKEASKVTAAFGIFQHYNYHDSDEIVEGSGQIPYKLAETVSFGPGFIYKYPGLINKVMVEEQIHASGIMLGGCTTDYYNVIDRNYNMGSGYSVKNSATVSLDDIAKLSLNVSMYQLFTWKGYKQEDLETKEPLYLDAQGDKGNSLFVLVNPMLEINLTNHLSANLEMSFYYRRTHYTEYPEVRTKTYESKLGLFYTF